MMALEEGQDGDSVVETLLELGASVAFNKKVGVNCHIGDATVLIMMCRLCIPDLHWNT